MKFVRVFAAVAVLAGALQPADTGAQDAVKIRLGTLAPRGTSWHRSLLEMGEKWRAAQGAGAAFIVYTDGSQGGEADMVRRMRVGQLNAALLSVVGLTEIDDSVSALQKMPMVFRSWDELDYLREKLRPTLEKRFLDKGFVVLLWGDAGWVRFFSKEPALRPGDYRRMKMFAWAGDNPQVDIMKSLGYQPVVLEIADILPGLQTGMINMVPSTPFYALVGQFYSHAPHMLDMNWVPIVGAVVITRKAWDAMLPAGQKALREAADATGVQLRAISRRENDESVEAMKKRGLKVQPVTPEIEAEWRKVAEQAYPMIRGNMVPAELFDEVQRQLREYRAIKLGQRQ
jgi:TRAP-type transport system periplasmic protein